MYCDYEFEKYDSVLNQCNEAIKQYVDDPIQAKFELLKSYSIYKLQGKKPFMTELVYVTVNYPKTEEAEHAQDMLDFLNGVKKPSKKKNKVKLKSNKSEGNKKKTPQRPSNTNANRERGGKESNKRQPSRNLNNPDNGGNKPGTRPPSGSNNKPSGNNNNQNAHQLGGG